MKAPRWTEMPSTSGAQAWLALLTNPATDSSRDSVETQIKHRLRNAWVEVLGPNEGHLILEGECARSRREGDVYIRVSYNASYDLRVSSVRFAVAVAHQLAHAIVPDGPLHGRAWSEAYISLIARGFDIPRSNLAAQAPPPTAPEEALDLYLMGAVLDRWAGDPFLVDYRDNQLVPSRLRPSIRARQRYLRFLQDALDESPARASVAPLLT